MTKLPYDPAEGIRFWEAIRKLPGFPANESMPIKEMIFESNALFRTTEILRSVNARPGAAIVTCGRCLASAAATERSRTT